MPDKLNPEKKDSLAVGLAQIAPVWLQREQTIEKMLVYAERAAEEGCELVAFGEALLPGYPFWIERTDGARFGSQVQAAWFARYAEQAVTIERGDLDGVREAARRASCAVYLGVIERPDRSTSVHASLVYVSPTGEIVAKCATLGDELITADCDLDQCRAIQENIFTFALHRAPQHYGLIVERKGAGAPLD